MKWILVAVVLQTPIKTDLVFDSLASCLQAESEMRRAYADVVNKTAAARAFPQPGQLGEEQTRAFMAQQTSWGTCIPGK